MGEPSGEAAPKEDSKRCCTCKEFKPLTEFNRLARASDGRQYSCRECNREWHRRNKARHNRMIHDRNRRVRAVIQEQIYQYLLEHPCTDCGEPDPLVLEFDHLRDKVIMISRLVTMNPNWETVLAEIAKCEVVCANCHRRRTAQRAGFFKARRASST